MVLDFLRFSGFSDLGRCVNKPITNNEFSFWPNKSNFDSRDCLLGSFQSLFLLYLLAQK